MFTANDRERAEFKRGIYTAKLTKLEEKTSDDPTRVDPETGDPSVYSLWVFEVIKGKQKGDEIVDFSSLNFGPRAKARQWAEGILDRKIEKGETVMPEDLYGIPVHIQMAENQNGRMAIASINPLPDDDDDDDDTPVANARKRVPVGVGASGPAEDDNDEDLDDIPF